MWMQQSQRSRARPIALALAVSAAFTPAARGQVPNVPLPPAQARQASILLNQANLLQQQSADLALQIGDLTGADPTTIPVLTPAAAAMTPDDDPRVVAAKQSFAAATDEAETVRRRAVAAAVASPEHKAATAALATDQGAVDAARAAPTVDERSITKRARAVLADKAKLASIERQALDASPEWSAADAKLRTATAALDAARAAVVPPYPPAIADKVRTLNLRRARTEVDAGDALRRLDAVSPPLAAFARDAAVGILEAAPQLRAFKKDLADPVAMNAPQLRFSPRVTTAVAIYLQGLFNDQYRARVQAVAQARAAAAQAAANQRQAAIDQATQRLADQQRQLADQQQQAQDESDRQRQLLQQQQDQIQQQQQTIAQQQAQQQQQQQPTPPPSAPAPAAPTPTPPAPTPPSPPPDDGGHRFHPG